MPTRGSTKGVEAIGISTLLRSISVSKLRCMTMCQVWPWNLAFFAPDRPS